MIPSRVLIVWIVIILIYLLLCHCTKTVKRSFIQLPSFYNKNFIINTNKNAILRVLQFNVLADGLSGLRDDNGRFSRVPKQYLDWNYRKVLILEEIKQYNPDIITAQEVDHYYDYFLPQLRALGYIGYFAPKPTSKCLEVSKNADGCAMFIRSDRLDIISCETLTLALSKAELTDTGEIQEDDIRVQNQVALIAVCELVNQNTTASNSSKRRSPPIIISTSHLKSAKSATGERYRERAVKQILAEINKLYVNQVRNGRTPSVVLTGDFNAVPENSIYEPLTYRAVKTHPLGLRSVYNEDVQLNQVKLSDNELYTTWKARIRGSSNNELVIKRCIDYIFYKPFQPSTVPGNNNNALSGLLSGLTGSSSSNSNSKLQSPTDSAIIASSSRQIAISTLLRFTVYFFGALIPLTSLLSTQMNNYERLGILILSMLCLLVFEYVALGSVFKPFVIADLGTVDNDNNIVNSQADKDGKDSSSKDKNKGWLYKLSLPNKSIGFGYNTLVKSEEAFLKSVASLGLQLQPLPQYGNPGFQAIAALDLLSPEEVGSNLIPSQSYPSDHIAIAADLLLLWEANDDIDEEECNDDECII